MPGRLPLYASGATVIAVLFLILPSASLYYDVSPKAAALLGGLAAVAICYGTLRADIEIALGSQTGRIAVGLLLCQVVLLTMATAFSTDPALSLAGSNWRRMGWFTDVALLAICVLVLCLRTREPGAELFFLRVLAFSGAPLALYAILQFVHVDPFLDSVSYTNSWLRMVRPPATVGHPMYLGNVLAPMFVASAALVRLGSSRLERWCAAGSALLVLPAIGLTDSRAALLGVLAGVGAMALRPGPSRRRRLAITAVVTLVLLLAGAVTMVAGPPSFRTLLERWRTDPAGGTRLPLWRDCLRMAAHPRPFGTGPETFSVVFPEFCSHDLAVRFPNHYHESPHNIFLDVWLSQGPLACLAFLCTIGLAFARTWHAGGSSAVYLPALLSAAVVPHLFSVFTVPDAIIFYVVLALALSALEPVDSFARPWAGWIAWGLRAFAVCGAVFAAQLLIAEWFLKAADRDFRQHRTADALRHYGTVQTWQPAGACYDFWFARNALAEDRPDLDSATRTDNEAATLSAARRAAACSEQRHNALLLLATVYARRHLDQATEETLRRAIAQAPLWYEPHFHLAELLARLGRRADALQEASRADDLSGGEDPRTHALVLQMLSPQWDLVLPAFSGPPGK